MQVERVPTANGIDDIKLIGDNDLERLFIKQLAEAGTLSCMSRHVADSILFRAISVTSELGGSSYAFSEMPMGKYDFTVRQNQNYLMSLIFDSPTLSVDLTDYSAIRLQVKSRKGAPAIIELAIGTGLTISGVGNKVLSIAFTAAQTELLSLESYYYDILMSKPTSNVYYVEGKITVKRTGTR